MNRPGRSRVFAGQPGGFALVTALVVLAVAATVLLEARLRAEAERAAALNAVVDVRTRAAARGGLAQLLLRLRTLQARTVAEMTANPGLADAWNNLDTLAANLGEVELPSHAAYHVAVLDPAACLPLNHASETEIQRLLEGLGADVGLASMDASLIADERAARGGRFEAVEDLARIPGLTLPPGWQDYLTALGDGRVNVNTAPDVVLAALPGMGEEAVSAILTRRAAGQWLHSVFELDGLVTGEAQAELRANFPALAGRVTFQPTILELVAEGVIRGARMPARISAIVGRAGSTVQLLSSVER